MSDRGKDDSPGDSVAPTDERRVGSATRRGFLATGTAITAVALAGCGGDGGSTTTGDPESDVGGAPDQPWSTEALADYVDDGTEVTIYSATGDTPTWNQLVEVINDEFDAGLTANVFNSDGGTISQRIIQERQAGEDKADVITVPSDIQDQIQAEGESVAKRYYDWDLDSKFWWNGELNDFQTYPWVVSAYNAAVSIAMPVNPDRFEEMGLDIPRRYSDLLDDQYEGMEVGLPGYLVRTQVGWPIARAAENSDMEAMEWIEALRDHVEFVGFESHTTGAEAVAQGDVPLMFYNFPWTVSPFVGETPLEPNFPEGAMWDTSSGTMGVNSEAPNPWAARLVISATLEPAVQKRIVGEVSQITPGRPELDYSGRDPRPYIQERLNFDYTPVTFWEAGEYAEVGQQAIDQGGFEY